MKELDLAHALNVYRSESTITQDTMTMLFHDQPRLTQFLVGWGMLDVEPRYLTTLALDDDEYANLSEAQMWELLWHPFLRDPFALGDAIRHTINFMGGMGFENSDVPAQRIALRMFQRAKDARYIYPDCTAHPIAYKTAYGLVTARVKRSLHALVPQRDTALLAEVKQLKDQLADMRKKLDAK